MVNKVILIGNLGKDPEVRYLSIGKAVCNLTVATEEKWKDKQSGEQKKKTEWHDVAVFGPQAEACGEYLEKGRTVYVEGKLTTEKWEDKKSGETKYRTKVVADSVKFLGGGKGAGKPKEEKDEPAGGNDSDIPF